MKPLCPSLIVLSLAFWPAAAQEIGVSEWVNPSAWGRLPGAPERDQIEPFRAMTRHELVQTDERGASDFLFDLGSRMLVGPGCEVVLDETYYNPGREAVASFSVYSQTVCVVRAGAGGETMVFQTPVARVTIREADATIAYSPDPQAISDDLDRTGGAYLAVSFNAPTGSDSSIILDNLADAGASTAIQRVGSSAFFTPTGFYGPVITDPAVYADMMSKTEDIGTAVSAASAALLAPDPTDVLRPEPTSIGQGGSVENLCAVSGACDAVDFDLSDVEG